jgi:hypothetical protein
MKATGKEDVMRRTVADVMTDKVVAVSATTPRATPPPS